VDAVLAVKVHLHAAIDRRATGGAALEVVSGFALPDMAILLLHSARQLNDSPVSLSVG
jgi:hypothetical protein